MRFSNLFIKISLTGLLLLCGFLAKPQSYEHDSELAADYYKKGIELKNNFKNDSADFYLRKASEIFEKYEDWENLLIINNEIGSNLIHLGKTDAAIAFLDEQIKLATEKFGENSEYLANLSNNLGLAYFFKGKIDNALELYDKSLAIRIAIGDKESLFASNLFNDMGNAYTEKGEFDLALDYYQKSLAIRKKILGENHPETAISYNNIGIIYKEQAQYDKAIEYHKKAIEIQSTIFGEDYPDLANAYQGIGNAYKDNGQLDQAMQFYQKAYAIRKKAFTEKHPLVAKDLINIAIIYTEKGETENALNNFQQALTIQKQTLGDNHPDMAMTYNNLGNIYFKDGQNDLALAFYMSALEIKKSTIGEDHPDVADYYTNIGNVYLAKHQYQEALDYQKKSLALKIRFYGQKHPAVVLPYMNTGNIYYQQGDFNQAISFYQKSLASNVKQFNPEPVDYVSNPNVADYYNGQDLLRSLRGKAKSFTGKFKLSENENDLLTAFYTYQKCDTILRLLRKSAVSKSDKIELGKISTEIYDEAIESCSNLGQLKKDQNGDLYLKEAFYYSEKNKAGVLLEALASSEASKFAGIPDNLLEQEKNLSTQISFYEKKLAETYDEQTEMAIRNALFKANNEYNKLIETFSKNYPRYHELKYGKDKLTIEAIQNMLDDKTAIRSYFVGDSLISIFTIAKNSFLMEKSVKPKDFDSQIFNFRNLINSNKLSDVKEFIKKSFEFYKMLFPNALPQNTEQLVIIPDGNLGLIPFEALFNESYTGKVELFNQYPFLIKKYNITYNYSTDLFLKQLKKQKETNWMSEQWVGIAPVFTGTKDLYIDGNEITALPGTQNEVATIGKKMDEKGITSKTVLFAEASENFMKSPELKNYKFVHIATHGFVNSEKPELSGIVLSENKSGNNDGVLYSGEIYNLSLNSDLVVLSACETGLGKVSKGEGIIGLSRALLYAGTNNIIVSLWKVADLSTSELMINFYSKLLDDRINSNHYFLYSNALRKSKLDMIENKQFGHPFFWSPFVLVGQ
ncbi:MAG: CHAT domain-containing tetratricopeptide repeat protein [Bacteroidales bacterium]